MSSTNSGPSAKEAKNLSDYSKVLAQTEAENKKRLDNAKANVKEDQKLTNPSEQWTKLEAQNNAHVKAMGGTDSAGHSGGAGRGKTSQ